MAQNSRTQNSLGGLILGVCLQVAFITSWLMPHSASTGPASASHVIAQATSGNIPSAGTILGWELNMNRQYTERLNEKTLLQQQTPAEEPPVIYYDNQGQQPSPNQPPYLLNLPRNLRN
ncbi:hypothetical protein [Vampirovibrio sp.]|uniref:hypothetical protein n=1 Tax=Vampirovibrio sp. TaxID=2717857 RepID=UPI0035933A74